MGKPLRWRNGKCESGHDIGDVRNVGYRYGKRYCKSCNRERAVGKSKPVVPWPDGKCEAGHDVTRKYLLLRRKINGVWTLVCRQCVQPDWVDPQGASFVQPTEYEPPPAWMKHDLPCAGADLDNFFTKHKAKFAANKYCANCPARKLCAEYADERKLDGLWGGIYRRITPRGGFARVDYVEKVSSRAI